MQQPFLLEQALSLSKESSKKMIKIEQLRSCLKLLMDSERRSDISLSQKGVLLQVLAKIILNSYHQFYLAIVSLRDQLHRGGERRQGGTTIKKDRGRVNNQNATTVRKRADRKIEQVRDQEAVDIEDILERELNEAASQEHVEVSSKDRSHSHEKIEQLDQMYTYFSESKMRSNNQDALLTPLQKIIEKSQDNLEQFNHLLGPVNEAQRKTKKKTDRKQRPKKTQPLSEHINSDINLSPSGQSRPQELMQILESTKKKKKDYEQFIQFDEWTEGNQQFQDFIPSPGDILLMKKFQEQLMERQELQSIHMNDKEIFDLGSFIKDAYSQPKLTSHKEDEIFFKDNSLLMLFEEELEDHGQHEFCRFTEKMSLGKQEKAGLFYALLCGNHQMKQQKPESFGEIVVEVTV